MKVFLLTVASHDRENDYDRGPYLKLKESAERSRFKSHTLTSNPQEADLILFAELHGAGPYFELIRRHPLVRKYREKCFLFCSNFFVIPFLPGVYASIEKRWCSRRTRSGFYLGVSENEFVQFTPPASDLPYLYSFVGSIGNAAVRRDLATLVDPRFFFQDTSAHYDRILYGERKPEEVKAFWRRYAETMQASKFVLCPRGLGPGTVRLFDTMRMGRVPVILSDDWVEPAGPRWNTFSIRIPEKEFARIPALLAAREADAVSMGQLAREQWEEWFSEDVCFHRVVEWCLQIKSGRRVPEKLASLIQYIHFLRPFHFRHLLRTKYQTSRRKNI